MTRFAIAAIAVLATVTLAGPAHAQANSATPVPGRYCKSADVGKKVTTKKYGVVTCTNDGDRARWNRK